MKLFLLGVLAFTSSTVSAQNFSKADFANLLSQRRSVLEKVHIGMSKKVSTTATFLTETGNSCSYTQTAVQTILSIEGEKLIVLSDESFVPATSYGCQEAQLEAFTEKILFYEPKPSLQADLTALQESKVTYIARSGEIVTMMIDGEILNQDGTTSTEAVTLQYDLTKPSFKNLISTQTRDYVTLVTDVPDVNVNGLDLRNVVFCASSDPNEQDCVQGDFSDILF